MIELPIGVLVILSETFVAIFIALALLSDAARYLPKWHRLLMSISAVILFVHAAFVIFDSGAVDSVLAEWAAHAKDLSIGALALAPTAPSRGISETTR